MGETKSTLCPGPEPMLPEDSVLSSESNQAADDELKGLFDRADTRELFYAALRFCREHRTRDELEAMMESHPTFSSTVLTASSCTDILVKHGALAQSVRIPDGSLVSTEDFVAMIDRDETTKADGALTVVATAAALEAAEGLSVGNRLAGLLKEATPEREAIYLAVLRFCAVPRTLDQIKSLLEDSGLSTTPTKDRETVYPSAIANALARAGALCWQNGWTLTQEGAAAIENR